METKTPPTKRTFSHAWEEIQYLRDKLLYWSYERRMPRRARRYADRLQKLLATADADQDSILGQECRSLIHELNDNLLAAIHHREEEIRKIRRLHEVARASKHSDQACSEYGNDALCERLDLLAILYDHAGDTMKAMRRVLEESKACSRRHGIRFDSQSVLDELIQKTQSPTLRNGRSKRTVRTA